jgi:hypothetical protein
MSRSGYSEDGDDDGRINLYRGTVARTIGGKRSQAFLREMAAALDAMPVKELIADDVVQDSEHVCALGAVAVARGLDVRRIDPTDGDAVGSAFGIARTLACEIAYENDERSFRETPSGRWQRMRSWVERQLLPLPSEGKST